MRIMNVPARDALNAGSFMRPLAFVRPDPIRTKLVVFARVWPSELMSTLITVFAGKPLTTGATGLPVGTFAVGAEAALVDTGAATVTSTVFAASESEGRPTPDGASATWIFR